MDTRRTTIQLQTPDGAIFEGETSLDVVEQMWRSAMDPADTLSGYMGDLAFRASYFCPKSRFRTHTADALIADLMKAGLLREVTPANEEG